MDPIVVVMVLIGLPIWLALLISSGGPSTHLERPHAALARMLPSLMGHFYPLNKE